MITEVTYIVPISSNQESTVHVHVTHQIQPHKHRQQLHKQDVCVFDSFSDSEVIDNFLSERCLLPFLKLKSVFENDKVKLMQTKLFSSEKNSYFSSSFTSSWFLRMFS